MENNIKKAKELEPEQLEKVSGGGDDSMPLYTCAQCEPTYTCPQCGEVFKTSQKLADHTIGHQKVKSSPTIGRRPA